MEARNFTSKKSPREQEELDVGNDDYDEETDEFATYSRNKEGFTQANSSTHSMKSSSSKKSTKMREREKNIKEIKMYYWSKVDYGDR